MNELNFDNSWYKNLALTLPQIKEGAHSSEEAFFLLINGLKQEDLSNLCKMIQKHYKLLPNSIELTIDACYKLTQNLNIDETEKKTIKDLAHKCLKKGLHLGSRTINDGKINTSAWISHSIYSGEVCATLARNLGLNEKTARTLGLMHDYGRKYDHSFQHILEGFQALANLGWFDEAIGCLTHSFVNGGRCSNNEPAIEGFYVDEDGNPKWERDTKKDDITLFLENYQYADYDIILNIADLMATSKGIVSPHERIADISTRRVIDPTNRAYFLADITNTLIDYLKKVNFVDEDIKYIKANKDISLEEIQIYFNEISTLFFNVFLQLSKKDSKKIIY